MNFDNFKGIMICNRPFEQPITKNRQLVDPKLRLGINPIQEDKNNYQIKKNIFKEKHVKYINELNLKNQLTLEIENEKKLIQQQMKERHKSLHKIQDKQNTLQFLKTQEFKDYTQDSKVQNILTKLKNRVESINQKPQINKNVQDQIIQNIQMKINTYKK